MIEVVENTPQMAIKSCLLQYMCVFNRRLDRLEYSVDYSIDVFQSVVTNVYESQHCGSKGEYACYARAVMESGLSSILNKM